MRDTRWSSLVVGVGIVIGGGLWSAALQGAAVTLPERASIVVRTYTQTESPGDLRTTRRTTTAILEQAAIEVEWLECGVPDERADAAHACAQPIRRNEVVVRIVAAGNSDSRPHVDTLGFAFVDAGGGSLATVYGDRTAAMAQAAGADPDELLGRAIAHEVGHLLLGTSTHAADGLMRARWSAADLRRNRPMQWLFGRKEGEGMRLAVATRLAF